MGIKYRWYRGNKDTNGTEFKEGDIVSGRTIVGILWKDVVGVVKSRDGELFLECEKVVQLLSEVNNREIIGHISKTPGIADIQI